MQIGPTSPIESSRTPSPSGSRKHVIVRVVLGVSIVVALMVMGKRLAAFVPRLADYIDGLGAAGAVLFVVAYAVACVAFVPGSILTLAAGAIFGLVKGVLLVFVAALLGSTAAFLIARYVARSRVEKRVTGHPKFAALDRAIGAQGRRIVFLLRLSPIFPFSLLNYALGLTRVSLADFVMASVGMLPGTVLYVYYGRLAGDVAAVAGGVQAPRDAGYYSVLALGLLATVVVTAVVARAAKKALGEATNDAPA